MTLYCRPGGNMNMDDGGDQLNKIESVVAFTLVRFSGGPERTMYRENLCQANALIRKPNPLLMSVV